MRLNGVIFRRLAAFSLILLFGITACSTPPSSLPPTPSIPSVDQTLVVTHATPTSRPPMLQPIWSPTAQASPSDAGDAVTTAMRRVQQAGPFHLHSVTTTQDGKTISVDADVRLPDRFHIRGAGQEVLIVGDQAYRLQGDQWVKLNVDLSNQVTSLVGKFSDESLDSISDTTFVGTETIDGLPTHSYRYRSSLSLGDETYESQNLVWISDASQLPVQIQSTGTLEGVQSTTLQTIQYDPSIKIEPPAP